jgi:hypothetical protein
MNTQTMERAPLTQIIGTVIFKAQAPAPNRSGKIKLEDGKILSAFPDKWSMVEVGGTYDFGCVVTEKGGVNYADVKVVRPATNYKDAVRQAFVAETRTQSIRPQPQPQQRSAPVQQQNAPPAPIEYNRATHPRDAERMFTCSILNAFIQTGRIDNDVAALTDAVNKLRDVWRNTFGLDEQ